VRQKFRDNASLALDAAGVASVERAISSLERESDLGEMLARLSPRELDSAAVRLENADGSVQVAVPARLMVSDFDVLYAVANAGLGIALLPAFRCAEEIRARKLERVLAGWNAPSTPVQVVYPSTRHLSPKVKSFVDHLHERMTPSPWELGPRP